MNKRILLLTCALGAVSFGATGAYAATATDAAQADQGSVVDIVVTAEKREQSLQEVPVAISAYTSAQRDLIGINNIQDMTDFTPGLVYSSVLDRASIRGVGRLSNNLASDAAVAVYSDDFFTTSTVEAGKPSLFTDRVEVLRGPQGTLYGRNAIGGAINVISKRPTKDLYAELQITEGNYGYGQYAGVISGPLTDKVRMRVSAYDTEQNQGYFKNVVPGLPTEGNVFHQWYFEAQLAADVGDRGDLWMKFATASWRNRGGPGARANYTTGPYDTAYNSPTAGAALFFNPAYGLQATDPVTGAAITHTQAGTTTTNPSQTNPRNFNDDTPEYVHLDNTYIFDLQYTQHFDNFNVKYVGGYDTYRYDLFADGDGTPVTSYQIPLQPFSTCSFVPGCKPLTINPSLTFEYLEDNHWYSHEINISSNKPEDAFQWLAGLFYYDESYHEPQTFDAPNQTAVLQPTALAGGLAAPNPHAYLSYQDYKMRTQSIAGYGQIDWKFAEHFKVTAGLRYTHDHKNGTESRRLVCYTVACIGDPMNYGTLVGANALDITPLLISTASGIKGVSSPVAYDPATGIATRGLADNWDAVTGTLGIEWTPTTDTNAYARYSRGYKSGGFNAGLISSSPETGAEHIDAYEAGLKKDFGRTLQVNVAIYYYNYTNFQAPISVAQGTPGGGTNISSVFFNVPSARSDGIEVESTWAPVDHLQLILSYSFNDTSITSGCNLVNGVDVGACIVDTTDPLAVAPGAHPVGPAITTSTGLNQPQSVRGDELPQAPKNKIALNANYTWVFDPGSLTLSGSYIWRDKQYGNLFTRTYNSSPSWSQTDFRVTWKGMNDKYEVIGYVRNAFDQAGYEAAGVGGRILTPGTTAAGAKSYTAPLVLQQYVNTYGINPPRTFGVEFHYKFF